MKGTHFHRPIYDSFFPFSQSTILATRVAVGDMGQCIQFVLSVQQQDRAIDAFRLIKIAVRILDD